METKQRLQLEINEQIAQNDLDRYKEEIRHDNKKHELFLKYLELRDKCPHTVIDQLIDPDQQSKYYKCRFCGEESVYKEIFSS